MLDLMKIGNKIKAERTHRNISQEELADKLYVSRQAISKWEMGLTMPSIDNICLLVEIFQTSIDEILCLAEPIDTSNLFANHSREFIVGRIKSGDFDADLSEQFYLFSPQERINILYSIKGYIEERTDNTLMKKINLDNLWRKLTDEEKQLLDVGAYKAELQYNATKSIKQ